jgi:NAD(P)-dependent dehydrogenase (short-subunit alcohol dehydrogenase family)
MISENSRRCVCVSRRQARCARHAIKRVIETSEQAAAILWLCSNEAAMITGQVLAVDGGWTAR